MALYDESTNLRPQSLEALQKQKVFKEAIEVAKDRVDGVTSLLDDVAFLDQYPGRRVPYKFSKRYEFNFVRARPAVPGGVGFDTLAPLVDLGNELLPVNGNIFVNREGAFYLVKMDAYGYASLTYDADPGFATNNPTPNPLPAAGFFDPALELNGGALSVNNFYGYFDNSSSLVATDDGNINISWDLRLRDKTKGKFLNTGRLPSAEVVNYDASKVMRFDPNTEIEPYVRILECRPGDQLDTDAAYNAAQFKGYLYLVFSGYRVLEV